MITKLIKYLKTSLVVLSVVIASYFLAAFTLSVIASSPEDLDCLPEKEIFIASNGVHLDLIIPREYLGREMLKALNLPPWVSQIAFGWGDKEFYIYTPTWNDLELSTAFQALFLDSESAIHVAWINNEYPGWTTVPMCDIQIQLLNDYLDATFKKDPDHNILEIEASGYSEYDKFYQANGNFSFIQTCNNWVNKGLKAAKVKTSIWSPFDQGVLYQVKKNRTGD